MKHIKRKRTRYIGMEAKVNHDKVLRIYDQGNLLAEFYDKEEGRRYLRHLRHGQTNIVTKPN